MRGTTALLRRLEAMRDAVSVGVPAAIESEVRLRRDQASTGFSTAQYEGVNDVVVTMTDYQIGTGHVWSIIADGEAVLFIEYGTGINLPHTSQFGNYGAYPPASWSTTHSRWLVDPRVSKWGGWWPLPKGVFGGAAWTQGNKSANVMYTTMKVLEEQVPIKARSALGKAFK